MNIGYFCAHEQNTPESLLRHAIKAENAGFYSIWTSDHFHPWNHESAQCGFAWAWLGAVGAKTNKAMLGTGVTSTSGRYNPAVTAQAFATLSRLYPGRVFLGLGTGEAMNEIPVGNPWPSFEERYARLAEFATIVRRLWSESFVTFQGRYYSVNGANLYTKPQVSCKLYVAADGPRAAKIAGRHADGLITTASLEEFDQKVKPHALEEHSMRTGEKAKFRLIIELLASYDSDENKALDSCKFWKPALVPNSYLMKVVDPRELASVGNQVSDDMVRASCIVGSNLDDHLEKLFECEQAGFDEVVILNTSPNRELLIDQYARGILPYFANKP